MKALDIELKALAAFLSKQKIEYAILGGIAVFVHGEPRFTADIDVNIIIDRQNIGRFLKNAKQHGFTSSTSEALKIGKTTGVIPMNFVKGTLRKSFDFILAENVLEFNAIQRAKTEKIGRVSIKVITPEDLIIHKITSQRARDIEDVPGILFRQKGKLDLRYIRKWLTVMDSMNKKLWLNKRLAEIIENTK